jgi:hypothetical protein
VTVLLKEDFQHFWEYNSPTWAGQFLDFWCQQTMRSRIEPIEEDRPDITHSPDAADLTISRPRNSFPAVWSRA